MLGALYRMFKEVKKIMTREASLDIDAGCPVQYCQRRLGPRLTAKTIPSLSPLVSEASDFPLSQGRAALRGSQAEVSYRTGA